MCCVRREKGLDAMLADYQNGAFAQWWSPCPCSWPAEQ